MEIAQKCVLCRGTANVEPVSFQFDEESLGDMVALHLPFITVSFEHFLIIRLRNQNVSVLD